MAKVLYNKNVILHEIALSSGTVVTTVWCFLQHQMAWEHTYFWCVCVCVYVKQNVFIHNVGTYVYMYYQEKLF